MSSTRCCCRSDWSGRPASSIPCRCLRVRPPVKSSCPGMERGAHPSPPARRGGPAVQDRSLQRPEPPFPHRGIDPRRDWRAEIVLCRCACSRWGDYLVVAGRHAMGVLDRIAEQRRRPQVFNKTDIERVAVDRGMDRDPGLNALDGSLVHPGGQFSALAPEAPLTAAVVAALLSGAIDCKARSARQ